MKRILFFYFTVFFLFITFLGYSSVDTKRLENLSVVYTRCLDKYSSAGEDEIKNYYFDTLLHLFDNTGIGYVSDILDDEGKEEDIAFSTYLNSIETRYKNKLKVDFKVHPISDCIFQLDGQEYAFIMYDKTVKYVGDDKGLKDKVKKTKSTVLMQILIPQYKVYQVIYPDGKTFGICNFGNKKQDDAALLFASNLARADELFKGNDFPTASKYYQEALNFKSNDEYSKVQLDKCKQMLNYEVYDNSATIAYNNGDYNKAKTVYKEMLVLYPEQKAEIYSKITICEIKNEEVEFDFNKKEGDRFFEKNNFVKAKIYYQNAQRHTGRDGYLTDRIGYCNREIEKDLEKRRQRVETVKKVGKGCALIFLSTLLEVLKNAANNPQYTQPNNNGNYQYNQPKNNYYYNK
ncbi:MAG: hypothetical protein NTX03_09330 [Bacteroidetes bacterium]|nr:hypothetical protein [Bacteroidota bacterium]